RKILVANGLMPEKESKGGSDCFILSRPDTQLSTPTFRSSVALTGSIDTCEFLVVIPNKM
ncbi:hypothetical protein CROQUDRAFT_39177, partial [Cronartium quercuum f. sp. fusiforme G11]